MKITQIYSNKSIQKILFNDEFNVVFAKVSDPKDKTKDSHNLGKSTLIALIDFLLLKELSKEHFLKKNYRKFKEYVFFFEIKNNKNEHLTIKRSVAQNTKISFHTHEKSGVNLTQQTQWKETDVTIRKAKDYLDDFLGFDVLSEDYSYRDTVSYFLRNQYDYKDVFQLEKNTKGKDLHWKPTLFKLLGFSEEDLKNKYNLENEKDEIEKAILHLERRNTFAQEEKDKILGIIQLKTQEKDELRSKLDDFNFILSEKKIKKEVVEEIERNISELNLQDYDLGMEEDRVNRSISQKTSFQIEECKKIFDEVNLHFPKELLTSYEDLVMFHKDITLERDALLKKRLEKIKTQRKKVSANLAKFNEQRKGYLSFIKSVDTFKKYKEYEKQIEAIGNEVFDLNRQLENFNSIDTLKNEVKNFDKKIDVLRAQISKAVGAGTNSFYNQLRSIFTGIVREILGVPAVLSLKVNKNGNIEFNTDIQKKDEITLTDEGKGTSYKKILCVAFDLALLVSYSKQSFFKFVYHDGVLEGLDNRMKVRFINYIRTLISKHHFQYIISLIEDDIPKDEDTNEQIFTGAEVAVQLSDSHTTGKLLKIDF